jgi:hypothetical protein
VTYGQDGCFFFWNKDSKSKLKNTKPGPFPVTAADFLDNGKILGVMIDFTIATQFAYAYGYDWGKGAEETKKQ